MAYQFPEDQYRSDRRFAGEYAGRVARGFDRARGASAMLCALARDLGPGLDRFKAAATAIGGLFAAWSVFVFENDSRDDTSDRLFAWSKEDPRVAIRSEVLGRPKWEPVRSGVRGDHMADYRNACSAMALAGGPADYIVVADADLAGYSLAGIASTIGADHWDAMGGQGLRTIRGKVVQYDVWAWRDLGHPHAHDAREINPRVYDRGHPPVPVLSCFGGIAVYKGAAFAAGRYAGGDCEHVPFHRSLEGAGFPRVFMNPGMVAVYPD